MRIFYFFLFPPPLPFPPQNVRSRRSFSPPFLAQFECPERTVHLFLGKVCRFSPFYEHLRPLLFLLTLAKHVLSPVVVERAPLFYSKVANTFSMLGRFVILQKISRALRNMSSPPLFPPFRQKVHYFPLFFDRPRLRFRISPSVTLKYAHSPLRDRDPHGTGFSRSTSESIWLHFFSLPPSEKPAAQKRRVVHCSRTINNALQHLFCSSESYIEVGLLKDFFHPSFFFPLLPLIGWAGTSLPVEK